VSFDQRAQQLTLEDYLAEVDHVRPLLEIPHFLKNKEKKKRGAGLDRSAMRKVKR
jgi:hypothetical protein